MADMDTSIDKLYLDIQVKDNDSANKLNEVADAIKNLTNSIQDFNGVANKIKSLQSVLNSIGKTTSRQTKTSIAQPQISPTTANPTSQIEGTDFQTERPSQYADVMQQTADIVARATQENDSFNSSLTQSQLNMLRIADSLGATRTQLAKLEAELKNGKTSLDVNIINPVADANKAFKQALGEIDGSVKHTTESAKEAAQAWGYTEKQLSAMEKEQEKSGKTSKKASTGWSSFVRSIGRIALYRAIRTILKQITQALTEGLQNYAKFDDATNKAMSNITNTSNQLKNTLGVTIGTLAQAFEPVITSISNAVIDLLNNINMAMASLSGKDSYSKAIKQNEDYADSLKSVNSQLLSFDTFNTLGKSDSSASYETVAVPDELTEDAKFLKEIFSIVQQLYDGVVDIVEKLYESFKENDLMSSIEKNLETVFKIVDKLLPIILQIIDPIMELVDPLLDIVNLLVDSLSPVLEYIGAIIVETLNVVSPLLRGTLDMISMLIKLLTGDFTGAFEDLKDAFKGVGQAFANIINGIANMFIKFINLCVDAINSLLSPLNWIINLFGGSSVQIPHWEANVNWQPFAKGGSFANGDYFVAGESGTELVASSGNGGAVMNMEQLESAIYNGMILAMADSGDKNIVLNVDSNTLGRVVANSTGFIAEMNRKNANLRLV